MFPLRALAFLVAVFAPVSQADRPTLNPEQSRSLVLAALTQQQRNLPGIEAETFNNPHSSRFMFYTVVWAAGEDQSVVVGNYAVDPYTGDVWSATSACDELSNPRLRALQKTVRQGLKLSQSEYKLLRTKGPLCD
jgi:hypothetical protein